MTKPKSKYPIEAFGPELMSALLRGGRQRVVLKFLGANGKALAHSFQRRIHTLRQRMRQEDHPHYILAAKAKVSIMWGEKAIEFGAPEDWLDDANGKKGAFIVVQPHDIEFRSILEDAGLAMPPVEPTITEEPYPNGARPEQTIDDLLSELQQKDHE